MRLIRPYFNRKECFKLEDLNIIDYRNTYADYIEEKGEEGDDRVKNRLILLLCAYKTNERGKAKDLLDLILEHFEMEMETEWIPLYDQILDLMCEPQES
ncbi:hypothetical protein FACS189472_13410 [Alphaproteobacteria bacterium]|nr:hypothetical protein FACS189472_13410 [Alphaproteobacteria bacterium]